MYFITEFQVVEKIVLLQHPLPPYTQFNSKQNKQDIIFLQQCKLSDEAQLKESSSSNRGATWQILLKMRPYYSQGSRVPVLSFTSVTDSAFFRVTTHAARACQACLSYYRQSTSWRVRRCPFTEQSGNPETVHVCDSRRLCIPCLFQLALFRVLLNLNSKGSGKEGSVTTASRCICLLPHPTLADCLVSLPSRCARPHMGTLSRPVMPRDRSSCDVCSFNSSSTNPSPFFFFFWCVCVCVCVCFLLLLLFCFVS